MNQPAWTYSTATNKWTGEDYEYDPLHRYFANDDDDGDVVEIEDVPGDVRTNLEQTARNGIAQILNQVPVLAVTDEIDDISKSFDQNTGSVMYSNVSLDGSFGSVRAGPCLIVFAVVRLVIFNVPQVMLHGYHLDNQVKSYAESVQVIQEMTAAPLNGNTVRFYVIGGDVGHNMQPENGDLNMDYSNYYPFFKACADQQVVFGGHRFPANPDGTTSASAAITTNQYQYPVMNLWIDNNDNSSSESEESESKQSKEGKK